MDASPLPDALDQLVTALEADGFRVVERRHDPQSFGNQLVELNARSGEAVTAVRLVRDRGLWTVDVQLQDADWFGPYEVILATEGRSSDRRALSHARGAI